MAMLGDLCLSNEGDHHGQDPDLGQVFVSERRCESRPISLQIPGAFHRNIVSGDSTCEACVCENGAGACIGRSSRNHM